MQLQKTICVSLLCIISKSVTGRNSSMTTGVVWAAVAAILDFVLNIPRMVTAKEMAKKLIDASTADDHSQDKFASFGLSLNRRLGALPAAGRS